MKYSMRYLVLILLLMLATPGVALARAKNEEHPEQSQQPIPVPRQVVLSVCILAGSITVRGWDRNEVQVRGENRSTFDLAPVDQANPAERRLITKSGRNAAAKCIMIGDIELDVPISARLKLETTNGDISVQDVSGVAARAQAGRVTIAKVKGGVDVSTIGGEMLVRDSTGSFTLHTVGGSVDAKNLGPSDAADTFQANAIGGDISLEHVRHQSLRVNTVSGDMNYFGPLARRGRYHFHSLSGDLTLVLPAGSSFQLSGSVGQEANVTSDFNLKYSEGGNAGHGTNHGPTRRIEAVAGSGESSINVSFFSGSVHIRKNSSTATSPGSLTTRKK